MKYEINKETEYFFSKVHTFTSASKSPIWKFNKPSSIYLPNNKTKPDMKGHHK